jgi:hypothetical protein
MPCYINGYTFEPAPNIVLMHLTSIHGPRAATGCTGFTLPTPLFNIICFLEPVVPLSDLIQILAYTQVT